MYVDGTKPNNSRPHQSAALPYFGKMSTPFKKDDQVPPTLFLWMQAGKTQLDELLTSQEGIYVLTTLMHNTIGHL